MKTLKELGISPAPWVSSLFYYKLHTPRVYRIYDAERETIATGPQYEMSAEKLMEMNHNADLISAAPDLYEVVRALVDDFAKAGEMNLCTLFDKAEAALKKAGGAE